MLYLVCALLTLSTLTTLASTVVLLGAARRWRSAATFWRQECMARRPRETPSTLEDSRREARSRFDVARSRWSPLTGRNARFARHITRREGDS